MIQVLLFCIALCASIYGAVSGNLLSLMIATVATMLTANRLFGRLPQPMQAQDASLPGIQQQLWLIFLAVAVLLAGLATQQAQQNPFAFASGYLWAAGLLLTVLSAHIHDHYLYRQLLGEERQAQPRKFPIVLDRLDWLIAGAIAIVALVLRLHQLSDFLPTMHGDEGEMGMLALLARHGPQSGVSSTPLPLFSTAFLDHPTLFHYMQAAAMWLFGESLQGLRTLSAIVGALCVPVVYAIGRLGWGRIAGITAGWLLAVSHLHLHYSRIALNNIETVWFTALFILLLMLAAETKDWTQAAGGNGQPKPGARWTPLLPYLWAGLAVGLSQYFYYGSRLIPVVAAPLLLFLLIKRQLTLSQLLMIAVATGVAYAPLAGHYRQNLPAFLNRTQGVSILTPEGMARTIGAQAIWPDDIPLLIWEQVKRNMAFFAQTGDKSAFYLADIAAFDPITVALFWLGLGIVLARVTRFHEFAVMVWFGLGVLLAGVLTNDAPYGPRIIVSTTSIYVIGGIFLQRLSNFTQRLWPMGSKWSGIVLLSFLALVTLRINYTAYFVTYARYTPNLMPISMAHEIRQLGNDYRAYLFGAPRFYADYSVLRFIAPGTERYNVEEVEQLPSLAEVEAADKGILVILLPHRLAELDRVVERLPGGSRQEHLDRGGNLMYVTYQIAGNMAQEKGDAASAANHQIQPVISQSPVPSSPLPLSPLQPTATPSAP